MVRRCNRCGTKVSYAGVSTGYSAMCPNDDEDLYLFEMYFSEGE